MSEKTKESTESVARPRVAAVVVPEHLHEQIHAFVEQLMATESGAESYTKFLEEFLVSADSGSRKVTTGGGPGTEGGDVMDISYAS